MISYKSFFQFSFAFLKNRGTPALLLLDFESEFEKLFLLRA